MRGHTPPLTGAKRLVNEQQECIKEKVGDLGEQGGPRGAIVTHQTSDMSMVQSRSEGLGEGISRVHNPGNVRDVNLATGFPFLDSKMLDVDVTGPGSRSISVNHEDRGGIVFVQCGRLGLWDSQGRKEWNEGTWQS